jgi:hypothetical protein
MRTSTMARLLGLLAIQSCGDAGGPDSGGPPENPPASAQAQVRTTTTGLDLDTDGFRVVVDGDAVGTVVANGTLFARIDPGSHTIALTGLAGNCTIDGAGSRTVTVQEADTVGVEFSVVCTATYGVVGVTVDPAGADPNAVFQGMLDGYSVLVLLPGGQSYVDVAPGDHLISVGGTSRCVVAPGSHPITVTVGAVVRDTEEVHFSVTCGPPEGPTGRVRITAPTTGSIPESTHYRVQFSHYEYWGYGGPVGLLGTLAPDGDLTVDLLASQSSGADPYWYWFALDGVPSNCSVLAPWTDPLPAFMIAPGAFVEVAFVVTCPP